jgi:hypothetical protein
MKLSTKRMTLHPAAFSGEIRGRNAHLLSTAYRYSPVEVVSQWKQGGKGKAAGAFRDLGNGRKRTTSFLNVVVLFCLSFGKCPDRPDPR